MSKQMKFMSKAVPPYSPVSYEKAINILSEGYIGASKSIRQALFDDATKRRIFCVKDT